MPVVVGLGRLVERPSGDALDFVQGGFRAVVLVDYPQNLGDRHAISIGWRLGLPSIQDAPLPGGRPCSVKAHSNG